MNLLATRILVVVGALAGSLGVVAHGASAAQEPAPFAVRTLSSRAGYFEVSVTCPRNASKVRFTWSPAANGEGWGEAAIKPGTRSKVRVRMLASAPGRVITATFECRSTGGRVRATFGPVRRTSGTGLVWTPPAASGCGRRIVYSLSAQQVWAYDASGRIVRSYLVSGRRTTLFSGSKQLGDFEVSSKSSDTGCKPPRHCEHMVRFNRTLLGNVGFHAIPSTSKGFVQTHAELGQPRSGGCVRRVADECAVAVRLGERGRPRGGDRVARAQTGASRRRSGSFCSGRLSHRSATKSVRTASNDGSSQRFSRCSGSSANEYSSPSVPSCE